MNCNPPGSSVLGMVPAGTLDCVGISSSSGSSWPRDQTHVSYFLHWQADSLPWATGGTRLLAQDKCPLAALSKMFPIASWAWTLILCEHHTFLHLGLFHKLGLLNWTHPFSCLPGKLLSIFQAQLKVLSPRSFFSPADITGAASPTCCPRWSPLLCHPVGTEGSELIGISSFFFYPHSLAQCLLTG